MVEHCSLATQTISLECMMLNSHSHIEYDSVLIEKFSDNFSDSVTAVCEAVFCILTVSE